MNSFIEMESKRDSISGAAVRLQAKLNSNMNTSVKSGKRMSTHSQGFESRLSEQSPFVFKGALGGAKSGDEDLDELQDALDKSGQGHLLEHIDSLSK